MLLFLSLGPVPISIGCRGEIVPWVPHLWDATGFYSLSLPFLHLYRNTRWVHLLIWIHWRHPIISFNPGPAKWTCWGSLPGPEPSPIQSYQDQVAVGDWTASSGDIPTLTLDGIVLSQSMMMCNLESFLDSQLLFNEQLAAMARMTFARLDLIRVFFTSFFMP